MTSQPIFARAWQQIMAFIDGEDTPNGPTIRPDRIVTHAVDAALREAIQLGNTLVLPTTIRIALPAEQAQQFRSTRLRNQLQRAVTAELTNRASRIASRQRKTHGAGETSNIADVRVEVVADDTFRVSTHWDDARSPNHADLWEDFSRTHTEGATTDAFTQPDQQITRPGSLRLVLSGVGGQLLGSAPLTAGITTCGRSDSCTLKVPDEHARVSHRAADITLAAVDIARVHLLNRNGGWVHEPARRGRTSTRIYYESGSTVELPVGQRLDLTSDGMVNLSLLE
jgi:hypothetical protein